MSRKTKQLRTILFLHAAVVSAQVQVSKEPKLKKVLENKYVRLLDLRCSRVVPTKTKISFERQANESKPALTDENLQQSINTSEKALGVTT